MTSPLLEPDQPVLVAVVPGDAPRSMTVDAVRDGEITLAADDGESLPDEWSQAAHVQITCLGHFSVYLIHVPVVRSDPDRLVIRAPDDDTFIQRRAYARVLRYVPVSCAALDADTNEWIAFEGEVRDLGGGGCSVLTDLTPATGSTIAMSFEFDDDAPLTVIARVLTREALPTIGKPLTRVEFVLIREPDRDRIMRFVLLSLGQHRQAQLRPASL